MGLVFGATQVADSHEIMIISDKGTLVRTKVDEVSVVGRNTQGVRLIRTIEGENVVALARIEEIEVDESLLLDEDGNVIEGQEIEGEAVEVTESPDADNSNDDE